VTASLPKGERHRLGYRSTSRSFPEQRRLAVMLSCMDCQRTVLLAAANCVSVDDDEMTSSHFRRKTRRRQQLITSFCIAGNDTRHTSRQCTWPGLASD